MPLLPLHSPRNQDSTSGTVASSLDRRGILTARNMPVFPKRPNKGLCGVRGSVHNDQPLILLVMRDAGFLEERPCTSHHQNALAVTILVFEELYRLPGCHQ